MLFINQMFVFPRGCEARGEGRMGEQSQIHCNLFEQLSGQVKCKQAGQEGVRKSEKRETECEVAARKGFVCPEIIWPHFKKESPTRQTRKCAMTG